MSDGWYETGKRAPRVSDATHAALTPRVPPLRRGPARFRINCGCVYLGMDLERACEKHETYVIQEEP